MNRYRTIPASTAHQKATSTTVCQKCLKKGHYSYQCKATAQERPYVSRPSRTQQLSNPKLAPKLLSEVPNDLLRKKGIADEQLAKNEETRGRGSVRHSSSPAAPLSPSRKRARSLSSSSTDSISTISTNRSTSPKGAGHASKHDYETSQQDFDYSQRSVSRNRKRRHKSISSLSDSESDVSSWYDDQDRNRRRRRRTNSPEARGRPSSQRRGSRRSRSRSMSFDKSRVARERKSMTPKMAGRSIPRDEFRSNNKDGRQYASTAYEGNRGQAPPRRERSLSPYSRRLALTQSMNMVR